ncbi:MAG: 4-hydroxybenzoate octaprenyltransferase [Pseudomonadota bacterium]
MSQSSDTLTRQKSRASEPGPLGGATTVDADSRNWVDAYAPPWARPYLRLIRADRPVGTWLLFIPCLWGSTLAMIGNDPDWLQFIWHGALFGVGAFVMRGAGCAYNDIVDQDIDAKVARTALRPIPAGDISSRNAWIFLVALCVVGLAVLVQFNRTTIITGIASLALVAAYPFMKRVTWWPQAWLGLTFNWGVLVGYAATKGSLDAVALFAYGAGVFWTLGYDTIYAHQDAEDDALIGVKSSARALGDRTKPALVFFYGTTVLLMSLAVLFAGGSPWALVLLVPAAIHLAWQVRRFDANSAKGLLSLFKSNRDAGFLFLAGMLAIVGLAFLR